MHHCCWRSACRASSGCGCLLQGSRPASWGRSWAALLPFRGHTTVLAVAMQVAGGALLYVIVLIACDFLQLREKLAERLAIRRNARQSCGVEEPAIAAPSLVETQ